jgi:peptidoglycan/xylan/chitin deacetylase (PgdA/CDA1 family)
LAQVDPAEQEAEIHGSKRDLEAMLGRPVRYFSYPFGTGADFNRTTARIAREAGFLHTAANYSGFVHARSPVHHFPRFLVRDWDGPEFAQRMDTFLHG